MAHRDELGRIDCPHCGLKGGMKITEDKSGNPFGNCDLGCYGQLRVGGGKSGYRVKLFYIQHPHIKKCGAGIPVTVTGGENPVTVTEKKQEIVHGSASATTKPNGGQVSVPVPAMPVKRSYAEDLALLVGGMKK